MNKFNDGGPAFPSTVEFTDMHGKVCKVHSPGISYLDHAALEAMKSLLLIRGHEINPNSRDDSRPLAHDAYCMAESMLAERERQMKRNRS